MNLLEYNRRRRYELRPGELDPVPTVPPHIHNVAVDPRTPGRCDGL